MKTIYSPEVIEQLSQDPNVKIIREDRLSFTLEFRCKIYDSLNGNFKTSRVRKFLNENGYAQYNFSYKACETINYSFIRHGRPKNGGKDHLGLDHKYSVSDPEYNEYLVNTGRFCWHGGSHKKIKITDEFFDELKSKYPEQTISDGLKKAGIDVERFGYQRLYSLENKIIADDRGRSAEYSDDIIAKYSGNPYVRSITRHKLSIKASFYDEVSRLSGMDIKDILAVYEIDSNDLSSGVLTNLKHSITSYKSGSRRHKDIPLTEQTLRIQYNRMKVLEKMADDGLRAIGEHELPFMDPHEKKALCLWISGFKDLEHRPDKGALTIDHVLSMIGMPRSTYYEILKKDDYGEYRSKKDKEDLEDIKVIRQVMDHCGFKKGARQIYMDMEDITGRHFNLKKIRRLMKKFGITSDIRKSNTSAKAIRELVKKNKKPNILKRRFKIERPDTIRLTDVTYLDYDGKRAYASAVKDPVTGRLIDLTVSDTNDLQLVMTSLAHVKDDGIEKGSLFHSDQGALYLTDAFQDKVKEYGMIQSMSKRGNCWDNAPQESFFGHFKDEADYSSCKTLEELKDLCDEYKRYYNYERHQWDLKKMTPIQYDAYLKNLSDEEFDEYIRIETIKYDDMKAKAAERAKVRAACLGV